MLQAHELYIATSSLYNYIDTKKLLLSAYHPTVETVGFPGLHFVISAEPSGVSRTGVLVLFLLILQFLASK